MANEIYDANGNYVGYVNSRGEIIDTKKGGLGAATENAGRKGAARNPVMKRTRQEQKQAKRRADQKYRQRRRNGR